MAGGGAMLPVPEQRATLLMQHHVLATDADERAVLAAMRCLRRAGFRVSAVGASRVAPGLWSRAPSARHRAPDPRQDVEGFLEKLERLVRQTSYDLLIPGTDASLHAVSLHRERFAPYVRLGLPDHATVERALDKDQLALAASDAGLAVPEQQVCDGAADARGAAERFGYPVIVKPMHTVLEYRGVTHRWASVLVGDAAALTCAADAFGRCIVQRRVQGQVLSVGGIATDGGLLASVVSRYIRTWPVDAGSACFSATVTTPPDLAARAAALVARLRWVGIFQLELIEQRDGRYAAIDFNPRLYGSLPIASAAGVPLAALWCSWVLGDRQLHAREAQAGALFRWEDADLLNLASCLRDRRVRSALAGARPRRGVTHAYVDRSDPAPAVARGFQALLRRARRPKGEH
jgi:predicted ATP-grasp superfamily ATP-dependent carboligase